MSKLDLKDLRAKAEKAIPYDADVILSTATVLALLDRLEKLRSQRDVALLVAGPTADLAKYYIDKCDAELDGGSNE